MHRPLQNFLTLMILTSLHSAQALAIDSGHNHDDHAGQKAKTVERIGDPYPLRVDPLGTSLMDVDRPIIIVHAGRELRFASEETLQEFKADPVRYLAQTDRRIIADQKPFYLLDTCVVSGESLGEMGEPVDFVYGNRLIRLCCKGCIDEFKKQPAQYLAKLDAAVIRTQKTDYPMATCVVSGEKLGGEMGEPIDYVIGNRLVRFCCEGCIKMFEKNPAKHLAAIDAPVQHEDAGHDDGDAGGHDQHGHGHNH